MVRLGLVTALGIGVLVFGYLAVRDLTAGMGTPTTAPQPETLALQPNAPGPGSPDMLSAQTADEALGDQYTPIDHDPAHLPAYPGARRDFCQRLANGRQYGDEQARYIGVEATVAQVLAHYQRAASDAGFTPRADARPLQGDPAGRQQVFLRGESFLVVTVSSPTTGPLRPPPALPPTPSRKPVACGN